MTSATRSATVSHVEEASGDTLAHRCHLNMVEAFASLPEHQPGGFVRRRDGIVVAATLSPIPLFNVVLPVAHRVEPAAFAAMGRMMAEHGLARSAQLRDGIDEALASVARDLGLEEVADASWPAMVRTPLPTEVALPHGFVVERATEAAGFDEHLRATGGDPRVTATWKGSGVLGDPRWMLFVGRADGVAVSKAMAFVEHGVVGIYDVSTRADVRRRGYGSAITEAALAAGRRAGCTVGTLQSSAMARRMYEAQGFRQLFRYRAFRG